MHLRVMSKIDYLGRRFYVEREFGFWPLSLWVNVGSIIGYPSEDGAKAFAEDYARGSWVSDSARFDASDAPEGRDTLAPGEW